MNNKLRLLATVSVLVSANHAWSAGYERSIMFGAKSAGTAGIATPTVSGAQALYFNPAGLAGGSGQELSFQISPVASQFSGPVNNQNTVVESTQQLSTPFGLMYSRPINDKMGFGIGAYVSGGNKVLYENVDLGTVTIPGPTTLPYTEKAEIKTDLTITEIAAGLGYKYNDKLNLGASWRVVSATAAFSSVTRVTSGTGVPVIANSKLDGLKDTQYAAFKLGAQYKMSEKASFAATFRSEVNFAAKGTLNTRVITPNPASNVSLAAAEATAKTTFPMAITLGGAYDMNEQWRSMWEYVFTQYSRVDKVSVESTTNSAIDQKWTDQHNVRLGGEYLGASWPVRFGYVYTSQVTNSDYARASFTPPGAAHTLTLGSGKMFTVKDTPLQFDIAGEYTTSQGDGKGAAAGAQAAGTDIRAGTYKVTGYGVHLGLTYSF